MSAPYRIAFKEFVGIKSPVLHPLLANRQFDIRTTQSNQDVDRIPVVGNTFHLIDLETSMVEFRFWSELNLTGTPFTTIKIVQEFRVQWEDHGFSADYDLVPHRWINEDLTGQQSAKTHVGLHPLLEHDPNARTLTLDCLVVDLTAFWRETHRENRHYKLHDLHWPNGELTLKVYGHLGGPPFIWYVVVPKHLATKNGSSPHVFFQPADNTEAQRIYGKDQFGRYGTKDLQYLKAGAGGGFTSDGEFLMRYLLPPVADSEIPALKDAYAELGFWAEQFRNVVSTKNITRKTLGFHDKPFPLIWDLRAGFERPFATGNGPDINQFLLMPQRPDSGNNVFAVSTHLSHIVTGIGRMLWANDRLIHQESGDVLAIGQYIVSCYSESGVDLWECTANNIERIKAVIAIEPQNMNTITNKYGNKTGAQIIPRLIRAGIDVYLIGRHHKPYYQPDIPGSMRNAISYVPDNPAEVFAYPPDPKSNDFVRYRISRLLDIDSDPLMMESEAERLQAARANAKSALDLYRLIFHPAHNEDRSADSIPRWYSHQFALSGGRVMALPKDYEKTGMYGKPVTYLTFFQECVEAIG